MMIMKGQRRSVGQQETGSRIIATGNRLRAIIVVENGTKGTYVSLKAGRREKRQRKKERKRTVSQGVMTSDDISVRAIA
jgi:hypothetical protein